MVVHAAKEILGIFEIQGILEKGFGGNQNVEVVKLGFMKGSFFL